MPKPIEFRSDDDHFARYRFEPIAVRIGQPCRFCQAVSMDRLAAVLLTLEADVATARLRERAHICASHVRRIRARHPRGVARIG